MLSLVMDLWDPSFCDLFFEPIPEEVLSLVDDLPSLQSSTPSASELKLLSYM